jgi:MtrB/PioB family decaheme-associated outer membrane protein
MLPRTLASAVACLLLSVPVHAQSQTGAATGGTPAKPSAQATAAPATSAQADTVAATGSFDFGARDTTFNGDSARFNQFRDMSNGLYFDNFSTALQRNNWFADFGGTHAGRRDALYTGELSRPGRVKVWGRYQSVPWLASDTTQTLFLGAGTNVLTVPDYVQSLLQTNAASITAVVPNLMPLTIFSERKYSQGGVEFMPDAQTTLNVKVLHMDRRGDIVGEGTFGFSAADELPIPVDHHQTDVDTGIERTAGAWLFRAGYSSSWFSNDHSSVTWDNPYQLADKSTLGSTGSLSLPPTSFMQSVNGTASVKLPMRTRFVGTVSFGSLTDHVSLLPETTNTTVPTFSLDHSTVDGDGRTSSANLILTSHPLRELDIDVRYRFYDYDNRTPVITQLGGRIEYDSTVELVPLSTPNSTTPFGLKSQTVDASATYDLGPADVGAGYSRDASDYTYRIFEGSTTNTGRITFDTTGSSWLALHGRYEHSERRGRGLDPSDLVAIGEQTTLQTFDIADRNEDVGTLTASLLLGSRVTVNLSGGGGKDTYPVNALSTGFGLASATYTTYAIGVAANPTDDISLSLSYDLNRYTTLQDSRSASPGVQVTDPTRNWSANANDLTHSVLGDVDLNHLAGDFRLRFTIDFNKGSTLYLYGLAPATTLPAVSQLSPVMSELRRGMVDVSHPLTTRATIGIAYAYEQFRVSDFAQGQAALAPVAIPSLLTLGNALLPYTAQTVFARMTYHW